MKIKLLSLIIIVFSFISGIIGSYIFVNYYNKNQSNIIPKQNNIVKKDKIINLKDLEGNITNIVKKTSPGVVSIIIKKDLVVYRSDPWGFFKKPIGNIKEKIGGGTGFFITKDGKIITNKHVIRDKKAIYTIITNSGEEYDAKFLAEDPLNDLAVLKIESKKDFEPLDFISENENINLGQFVIAIGNAMAEFQNSISLGIVSGKDRTIEIENGKLSSLIQTDAAINPGNSGGPLINLNSKVIGINTAIVNGNEGIGFAIMITKEKIDYILHSIEKYNKIKRPFIGISYIPISPGIKEKLGLKANYGAYIIDEPGAILKGSSADKIGLEPGDTILTINKEKLGMNNNLNTIIQNKIPGEKLSLEIIKKNGKKENLILELGEY